MANEALPLHIVEQRMKAVLQRAPTLLGNQALNFFKDRFKEQAWLGDSKEPWAKRKTNGWKKDKRTGRAILVDSGRLKRSIRIVTKDTLSVTIGSDVPYARAHNEGMRLGLIQQVKSFSRKTKSGKMSTVKSFSRKINQRIPKRQFIGNSPYLSKQLQRTFTAELMKAVK